MIDKTHPLLKFLLIIVRVIYFPPTISVCTVVSWNHGDLVGLHVASNGGNIAIDFRLKLVNAVYPTVMRHEAHLRFATRWHHCIFHLFGLPPLGSTSYG